MVKRRYIGILGVLLSTGIVSNFFAAASPEDIEGQRNEWEAAQRVRRQEEQKCIQENLTPEQKALGKELIGAAGGAGLNEGGDLDTVKRLIAQGAPLNYRDSTCGNTALMRAVEKGRNNIGVVRILIAADADLDVVNKRGNTALKAAVEEASCDLIRVLILAGADITRVNNSGQTVSTILNWSEEEGWLARIMHKINNAIEHAVEERERAERLPAELEQHVLLLPELRIIIMDYEQEPELTVRRRAAERLQKEKNRHRR